MHKDANRWLLENTSFCLVLPSERHTSDGDLSQVSFSEAWPRFSKYRFFCLRLFPAVFLASWARPFPELLAHAFLSFSPFFNPLISASWLVSEIQCFSSTTGASTSGLPQVTFLCRLFFPANHRAQTITLGSRKSLALPVKRLAVSGSLLLGSTPSLNGIGFFQRYFIEDNGMSEAFLVSPPPC